MQNDLDQAARLKFLQIDEATRAALMEFRPLLAQHIDPMLDAFYDHIKSTPAALKIFTGHSMEHARKMQRMHWLDNVFSGRFDEAYFAQAVRIGKIHEKVGLEPRWYLGGYAASLARMSAIAAKIYAKQQDKLALIMASMQKAAMLDMDLAISVYNEAGKETAHALMAQQADKFESEIGALVEVVAAAATELQASAGTMSHTAENTTRQAETVTASAQEAAGNVQTVASATEELSASIQEISRQVSQSTEVASNAVGEAERTSQIIQGLVQAAGRIGDVVKLINTIARQTNMLALNATIEAARAGEAGRGFAVVAGEVKNLANQTAHATGEISSQVNAVQAATQQAVNAIGQISGTIGHISEIASAIAAAVEQQGAATQDIARNINQAASHTASVTSTILQVTAAAEESGHTAHDVLNAASELSRQAETLSGKVGNFLSEVRRK